MTIKKRLSKALAAAGIASRRAAEALIFAGEIEVNGKPALLPQLLVNLQEDKVFYQGRRIGAEERKVYYILNKPAGYICSNSSPDIKKLVIDLFDRNEARLFTVGRLDRDTTGLLIVTNDGHFAHKMIHPSMNIVKEYVVKVHGEVTTDEIEEISKGMWIDGAYVKPKKVDKVRKGTLKVVVSEGKNREVRRLVEKSGLEIQTLMRARIGNLRLGKLPIGAYRTLTDGEKRAIFE